MFTASSGRVHSMQESFQLWQASWKPSRWNGSCHLLFSVGHLYVTRYIKSLVCSKLYQLPARAGSGFTFTLADPLWKGEQFSKKVKVDHCQSTHPISRFRNLVTMRGLSFLLLPCTTHTPPPPCPLHTVCWPVKVKEQEEALRFGRPTQSYQV
jgi:hypothetical protein